MNREERRNSDKPMILTGIIILAAIAILTSYLFDPIRQSFGDKYERAARKVAVVKIVNGKPNVRSEPIVLEYDDGSNSFGNTTETKFTIELSAVFTTDKNLDQNGSFYGFKVKEILATPEGKKWFPKGIKKDPDGIVWVNAKYVQLI